MNWRTSRGRRHECASSAANEPLVSPTGESEPLNLGIQSRLTRNPMLD